MAHDAAADAGDSPGPSAGGAPAPVAGGTWDQPTLPEPAGWAVPTEKEPHRLYRPGSAAAAAGSSNAARSRFSRPVRRCSGPPAAAAAERGGTAPLSAASTRTHACALGRARTHVRTHVRATLPHQ